MSGALFLDNALERAVWNSIDADESPRVLCLGSEDVLQDAMARFPTFEMLTSSSQADPSSISGIVATIDNPEILEAWSIWRRRLRVAEPAVIRFLDVSFVGAQLEAAQIYEAAPSLHQRLLPQGRLVYFDIAPLARAGGGFVLRTVESCQGIGLPNRRGDLVATGLLPSVERALESVDSQRRTALAIQVLRLVLGAGVDSTYQSCLEALDAEVEESAVRASLELLRERDRYVDATEELERRWRQKLQELRRRELETLEVAESSVRLADDLLETITDLNSSRAWRTTQRMRQLKLGVGRNDALAEVAAYAGTAREDLELSLIHI